MLWQQHLVLLLDTENSDSRRADDIFGIRSSSVRMRAGRVPGAQARTEQLSCPEPDRRVRL